MEIELNQKIYNWTIVSEMFRNESYRGFIGKAYWEIQCQCGTKRTVRKDDIARLIKNGSSKNINTSCRKCLNKIKQESQSEIDKFKSIYTDYKSQAKKRGIDFELSKEDCFVLFKGDCFYCNSVPSNLKTNHNHKEKNEEKFSYLYQGIDRVDSKAGYTKTNTVSCCKDCNYGKGVKSESEFLNWITKVYINKVQRLEQGS